MNWLAANWHLVMIPILVVIGTVIGYRCGAITKENIINWLLIEVTNAEKVLGSGTGRLKLSMVYDAFISKFPFVAKITSFKTFSAYVDIALEQMKKMLEQNQAAKNYIEQ